MANPWFRLYSEFSHDPKVQMLSEAMQRRYIMLMCMRCSNDSNALRNDEIAFHLRISNDELAETKELFVEKGFIDSDWNLLNWEKRQFKSDRDLTGAERQKRFRDRVKEEKENRNALRNKQVTLPDTDTDTDKYLLGAEKVLPTRFEEFWKCWPKNDRKQDKKKCSEVWQKEKLDQFCDEILLDVKAKRNSRKWLEGFVEAPLVYLHNRRWEDSGVTAAQAEYGEWFAIAGFESEGEARNFGCLPSNSHQFHDGKKLEVA